MTMRRNLFVTGSMMVFLAVSFFNVIAGACARASDSFEEAEVVDRPKFWAGSERMRLVKLSCQGHERSYYLYCPNISRKGPLPLVIACHGGGGMARRMDKLTGGITRLADAEGFVVAFPQGLDKRWNDGRMKTSVTDSPDDVGFINKMIDREIERGLVDPGRVYATGISNGGFFSQYLALKLPTKIAAVASVAATVPESFLAEARSEAVPVMFILGTEDPLIPYKGGPIGGKLLLKNRGSVLPAAQSINFWLDNNKLDRGSKKEQVQDKIENDGTSIVLSSYGGDEVVVFEILGGGHTWPRGWKYLPESLIGKTSQEIDATKEIWKFFVGHSLQERPQDGKEI